MVLWYLPGVSFTYAQRTGIGKEMTDGKTGDPIGANILVKGPVPEPLPTSMVCIQSALLKDRPSFFLIWDTQREVVVGSSTTVDIALEGRICVGWGCN